MTFTDTDKRFMRRALALAGRAKGATFPNPAVGAVVVDGNGYIVGEGATDAYGGPHAERRALKMAGARARGAVMYVTLEPCPHFGKTPPCVDAIIEAGIGKVIAAVGDPNPLVSGEGVRQLKLHGVEAATGLLAEEAAVVNEDFFWSIVNRRPWVSLKLAMTLDGRIADCLDGSKWITSEAARRAVQEIRRRHMAIAVGRNTLVSDDPKLTARCGRKTYYPARIVFCSNADDIPKDSYFLTRADEARTIIVVKNNKKRGIDRINGVERWYTGSTDTVGHIDAFLDMAHSEGIGGILIEGGQRLASGFLENGFVNKLHLFYGNKIFGGGKSGLRFTRGLPVTNCVSMTGVTRKTFGDDIMISGYVNRTAR